MGTTICTKCGGANGLPYMKGEVIQEYDHATHAPQITEWTCPYCGYKETEEIPFEAMGGTYNSGVVQGPVK